MAEKVEIKILVDKETGAFNVVGNEVKGFANQVESAERRMTLMHMEALKMNEAFNESRNSTNQLSGALTGLVAGAAVLEFFRQAINESMHEAEALRVLRGSVESTGAAWEDYRETIERFAKVQQETTRFADDQTYETLGRLARATNNVAQAMRATELAQDLAVKSGRSLAETTDLVNNLLIGQERAVKAAVRDYGNYALGAKTAQEALDNLERSVRGAAAAEQGALKAREQAKAAWSDTVQIVGDMLAPAFAIAATEARSFFQELQNGFGIFGPSKTAHEERVDALRRERDALFAAQAQLQHYGITTKEQVEENYRLREALKAKNAELAAARELEKQENAPKGEDSALKARQDVEAAQRSADQRREIERKLSDDLNKQLNDEFDYKRMKLDEEVAAARQANVDKLQVQIDGTAQEVDLATYKSVRELQIAQEQAAAMSELDRKTIEQKGKMEKQQQELEKVRKQNFASTMDFIATLSTAKNKELAMIGKAAGLANAYINTGVAVTRALAAAPPPYNFVLAAAVGAAGAAQIATIAGVQLEKGGVTDGSGTQGILAQIGEKRKKEGILPLEDRKAMGMVGEAIADAGGVGGGGGGGVVVNLGGVVVNLTATDLSNPVAIREIAIGLAQEIAAETEEAIVLARRAADLNAKNAERAA